MKITLTGAGGFLGGPLIRALQAEGHQLHALGRKPIPGIAFSPWNVTEGEPPREALEGSDAVIHLAGEPVAQRWSPEVKARIRDSRVIGTRHLVHALSTISRRQGVLISASAVGIYGSRGDKVLTEKSKPGSGFLEDITVDWEKEAGLAEALGMRVVQIRIGVVLGKDGGALAKMLPPFRAGVGGPLASGKQWMSWIHVDDVVGLILFALSNAAVRGPVNATAPHPVTNAEFTRELGKALHRPAFFPVPEFALRLLFGEMASVVLASQRVLPQAAESAGYQFRYPELPAALASVVS
jgi:uncharacterized protein (TIGR01777 family)